GDIRGPIRSPSGFHVVKLVDKRASDAKNLSLQKTQVRHILIKTNALLSDDEARYKLRDFKRELESGTDFAIIAKTHSEDLASANQGGDLGWVTSSQLVPEFSAVMDKTAIGGISDPFNSPFGWHILQVLDRKEEKNSEAILKQNAMNMIKNRKAEEKLENWLRQMRDEAYIQVHLPGYTDDPA
ncbi:MAG TPA: peptidylprolyl isomerase, partial [Gammaproteobacteria bacterium]|nr:peptidylprolyl isomerase [Gammaproteobacteria bacterium]